MGISRWCEATLGPVSFGQLLQNSTSLESALNQSVCPDPEQIDYPESCRFHRFDSFLAVIIHKMRQEIYRAELRQQRAEASSTFLLLLLGVALLIINHITLVVFAAHKQRGQYIDPMQLALVKMDMLTLAVTSFWYLHFTVSFS